MQAILFAAALNSGNGLHTLMDPKSIFFIGSI